MDLDDDELYYTRKLRGLIPEDSSGISKISEENVKKGRCLNMSNEEFLKKAKEIVSKYAEHVHTDKSGAVPYLETYVVWSCKTLQNSKALLSTTISDGRYYEVTYNGDKNEIYLDVYVKEVNRCIKVEE